MEQGPVDELMRRHFLLYGESLDPKWWEGFRWGIKTAFTTCMTLPHSDEVRRLMNTFEGQSEMSKRRQRWCEEEQAKKSEEAKPLNKIKKLLKRDRKKTS